MQAWQNYRSYYALVEIIDTYIHPMRCQQTGCNKATKKEVLKYLGPGENDPENGHPNSGPNLWIYSSARKIPFDSYIMISFDEAGRVSDIGSCSE